MTGYQITPRSRGITEEQKREIALPIITGLRDLTFSEPGLFRDRAGFIAGSGPTDALSNTVRAISRLNCRIWARSDKTNYAASVNVGNQALCTPFLSLAGEVPPDGQIGPPGIGGQCSGVQYRVRARRVNSDNSTNSFYNSICPTFFFGPIQIIQRPQASAPGSSEIGFFHGSPTNRQFAQVWSGQSNLLKVDGWEITRCDGLADPCGNQQPESTAPGIPPSMPIVQPRVTVSLPGFGPVNVNISLDGDGRPTFNIEDLDFSFDLDADVDGPGGGGPGGGGGAVGDGLSTPGDAGSPGDTGAGGAASGEAGEGEELVGVLVQILGTPQDPNVFDNNAAQVFRGVGYVRMGYPGRLGVDITGGTVLSPQFFHAQQRGLTAWEVRANLGFNIRATPYYREIPS